MILGAQAVIEFIGIMLFTSRVGGGVVAIMPQGDASLGVATHTAAMVFPTTDFLGGSGVWSSATTIPNTTWSYIEFKNNDHVTFTSTASETRVPTTPKDLRHLKNDWVLSNGGENYALDPGYDGPNYSKAVAVVTLTSGRLDACVSKGHGGRMESTASFEAGTELRVQNAATNPTKTFRLRVSGDRFVLIYAPLAELFPTGSTPAGNPHYLLYCAMAQPNTSLNCSIPFATASNLTTCPVIDPSIPLFSPRAPDPHNMNNSSASSTRGAAQPAVYKVMTTPQGSRVTRATAVIPTQTGVKAGPNVNPATQLRPPAPLTVVPSSGSDTAKTLPVTPKSSSNTNPTVPKSVLVSARGTVPLEGTLTVNPYAMSADCSNTQWP